MSDDQPIEPDPVIETALRLLPVPDHEDGFWQRVSATLADERPPEPARAIEPRSGESGRDGTAEVPVLELVPTDHLALVPTAVRRGSNLVLSAVAVAAAVVVVVAATTLVRSRSGDSPAEVAQEPTETDGTDTTLATLTAPDDDPAAAAVVLWVNALAEGDMESAWDVLSPTAQSGWGDQSAFAAERSAFAEGYGAWAHSKPDQILVAPVAGSDDEVVIVTLVGMVEQEGVANMRADAFPVRMVDGKAELHLSPVSAGLEFVVPDELASGTHPTVTEDSLVVVVPDAASTTVVIRLDGGDVLSCGETPDTELTELDGGYGRRCEYTPDGGLDDGIHVLTAAYISADGADITAQSVVFEAA